MNNIKEVQEIWADNESTHKLIGETFYHKTNEIPVLKDLRDFIETNTFGHGERAFYWMWKLIIDTMPARFTFLEVGIHRGQILVLVKILSDMADRSIARYGISPMDGTELNIDSDYYADIERLHRLFNAKNDFTIIKGLSTDPLIIEESKCLSLDILYIDGGHSFECASSDIKYYSPLIKLGGFLIIDDCANSFKLPSNYFFGLVEVSRAVEAALPPFTTNDDFEFLFNVGHNLVWRKVK